MTILSTVSTRYRRMGLEALRASILMLAVLTCACTAPREPLVVTNPDPSVKIPAIKASTEAKDLTAAQQMIKDLNSDDPAVRFYAIGGLQRMTGETFGYQYYMDDEQRAPAIGKWKAWLAGWEAGRGQAAK